MALIKCPRCELNYIEEGEGYCKICKREMKGEKQQEEIELCTICNEAPALPGKDICMFCLKEMNEANNIASEEEEVATTVDEATMGIDPVSTMDEIIPEIDENIPEHEYSEIENDLSLEEMSDEEAEDDPDEKEENE